MHPFNWFGKHGHNLSILPNGGGQREWKPKLLPMTLELVGLGNMPWQCLMEMNLLPMVFILKSLDLKKYFHRRTSSP